MIGELRLGKHCRRSLAGRSLRRQSTRICRVKTSGHGLSSGKTGRTFDIYYVEERYVDVVVGCRLLPSVAEPTSAGQYPWPGMCITLQLLTKLSP